MSLVSREMESVFHVSVWLDMQADLPGGRLWRLPRWQIAILRYVICDVSSGNTGKARPDQSGSGRDSGVSRGQRRPAACATAPRPPPVRPCRGAHALLPLGDITSRRPLSPPPLSSSAVVFVHSPYDRRRPSRILIAVASVQELCRSSEAILVALSRQQR